MFIGHVFVAVRPFVCILFLSEIESMRNEKLSERRVSVYTRGFAVFVLFVYIFFSKSGGKLTSKYEINVKI